MGIGMNLQESIRKDLNLLSEAPSLTDSEEENPLFVIDKDDFLMHAVYDDFLESLELWDFARFITDTIQREGKYTLELNLDNLWQDVTNIPAHLIKNMAQIQREYPKTYDYIESMDGYIEEPGSWARVKFVG